MKKELINKLITARYLYEEAAIVLKRNTELSLYIVINLLQDCIEMYMLSVAYFLDASVNNKEGLMGYINAINKKVAPYEIPFKDSLIRLNKIRVNCKHYGVQPNRSDCEEYYYLLKELFNDVTKKVFSKDFFEISLLDSLRESEAKSYLEKASEYLSQKDYRNCSIECRKAIYIEFEKKYDISIFLKENLNPFETAICSAPYYSKNKEYIIKNVKEPTDYIVIDHTHLEMELLKYSIDQAMFWNIWRLTPNLYMFRNRDWAVKGDFELLSEEHLNEHIQYIFDSSIQIIYQLQSYKDNIRSKSNKYYCCYTKGENIPIYERADENSEVTYVIPEENTKLNTNYYVDGLNGKDDFFYVFLKVDNDYKMGYVNSKFIKQY